MLDFCEVAEFGGFARPSCGLSRVRSSGLPGEPSLGQEPPGGSSNRFSPPALGRPLGSATSPPAPWGSAAPAWFLLPAPLLCPPHSAGALLRHPLLRHQPLGSSHRPTCRQVPQTLCWTMPSDLGPLPSTLCSLRDLEQGQSLGVSPSTGPMSHSALSAAQLSWVLSPVAPCGGPCGPRLLEAQGVAESSAEETKRKHLEHGAASWKCLKASATPGPSRAEPAGVS